MAHHESSKAAGARSGRGLRSAGRLLKRIGPPQAQEGPAARGTRGWRRGLAMPQCHLSVMATALLASWSG